MHAYIHTHALATDAYTTETYRDIQRHTDTYRHIHDRHIHARTHKCQREEYNVFSYSRMCSLTLECVLLLRMCPLTDTDKDTPMPKRGIQRVLLR